MIRTTIFRRGITPAMLVLAGLAFAVWMWCAGPWADDWPYQHIAQGYDSFFKCSGPAIDSVADIPAACVAHFVNVNGRLSNIIAIILMQLPLLLSAALQGAMFALFLYVSAQLIGGRNNRNTPLIISLLFTLCWLLLPWDDCRASQVFMVNYLWSGTLNLLVLLMLLRGRTGIGACLLAAISAPMHESMGLSMDCMIFVLLIINYPQWVRERSLLRVPAVYILFSLIPLLSPALRDVVDRIYPEWPHNMLLYHVGVRLWVIWLAVGVAVVALLKKRDTAFRNFFLMTIGGIVTVIIIAIVSHTEGRAYWFALLLAIVLAGRALGLMIKWPGENRTLWLSIPLFVLTLVWMGSLCRWQLRCSCDRDLLMERMNQRERIIVQPIESYNTLPWYLLNIPGCAGSSDITQICNMTAAIYGDDSRVPVILPDSTVLHRLSSIPAGSVIDAGRGLQYYVSYSPVSRNLIECTYLTDGRHRAAVNPIYSARYAGDAPRQINVSLCGLPVIVTSADAGFTLASDTLYFYQLSGLAHSLYGHTLIKAEPYDKD